MPPKVRRPAAAVAQVLRRPAVRRRGPEADQWIKSSRLKLEDCAVSTSLEVQGEYWEGAVQVAGEVVGALIGGVQRYLKIRATGTRSEALLKYLTGSEARELQLHICGDPCEAKTWREDLVHIVKVRKIGRDREAWMDNLGEKRFARQEEDQNEELRREAEEAHAALRLREEQQGKKEDRKEKKDAHRGKKKKKKDDLRPKATDGRKALDAVFGGTGLDPDPAVRKKVVKKAKRIRKRGKKKRRRSSTSGSNSSGSTSSSDSEVLVDVEVFEGERESHRLWKRTPGALTLATVMEAQQTLLTRQGVHPEIHKTAIPPILVQYFRGHLQPQMGPALSRESHHWSMLVDLLLQGEVARACDLACQRLKSLESYSKGVTLDIARNLELVPPEKTSLASRTETSLAGRLASEEQKVNAKTRYPGKGGETSQVPPGERKGKGKGDGKKGKYPAKGGKKGKEEEKEKQA